MKHLTTLLLRIEKSEVISHVQVFRKDIIRDMYTHVTRLEETPDETATHTPAEIIKGITDILSPLVGLSTAEAVGMMSPEILKKQIISYPFYYLPVDLSHVEYISNQGGVIEVVNGDGTLFCAILANEIEY